MILTLFLLGMFRLTVAFNFSVLEKTTGAFVVKAHDTYISYNNWKFVYYYDLSNYYDEIDTFTECFQKMAVICSGLTDNEPCNVLINRYQSIMEDINIDIEYIKSIQSSKRKRDAILGMIGTYIHKPIFGLMDEEDAMEMYNKINLIINKQGTHSRILEDNLSIIQRVIKFTNSSLGGFRKNIDELNEYVQNVTSIFTTTEQEIKQHINFKYLSSLATLITMEHERMTRKIKDILKQTLRGEFTEFITYEQLMKDIHEVVYDLDESSFMIMEGLRDIQQVVSIQGTIKNKRMMIELTLPILSKNVFTLNKIIALPIRHEDSTVIFDIDNQHYLVNNETRVYIPISNTDLQNCKTIINQTSLICFPQTEIYYENEKLCESNILFHQNSTNLIQTCSYKHIADTNYIKRLSEKSYYVSIKEPIEVRENCIKQATNFYTLKSTGILKMNFNCEIILNGMKITTRNTKIREQMSEVLKKHNYVKISIENITMIEPQLNKIKLHKVKYLDSNDDFKSMIDTTSKNIELLQKSGVITQIETGLFKKNIIYLTIFIMVIIVIKTLINKFC